MWARALIVAAVLALSGCSTEGARDVEYTQSRAISADIAAARPLGTGMHAHGQMLRDEPYDVLPWQLERSP